jgi:hypothetical protein
MTLLVEHPDGYRPERDYAHGVVLSDMLGLSHRSAPADITDVRIRLDEDPDDRAVVMPDVLFGTPTDGWLTPASLPARPLRRVAHTTRMSSELPLIFGAPLPGDAPMEVTPDVVRLAVDVFGSAFFMLTRYEELISTERDERERFPASASLSLGEGILERPIVNEYVELLWTALSQCWPRLRRRERHFRLRLPHDVDRPFATAGVTPGRVARHAVGDVVLRREPGVAVRRFRSLIARRSARPVADPYDTFDFLARTSERHGVRSAFYFMAHDDGDGYDPVNDPPPLLGDPRLDNLMLAVHAAGHEIGLHPSYNSFRNADRTRGQFTRLREAVDRLGLDQDRWGGRQHYLRWEAPATWQHWDEAGLDYDSSVGYADAVGFRSGVCEEHAVFDLRARRQLDIRERPLNVMDVTVFGYLGLRPPAALERICDIARACREHGGELVVLWHNNTVASRRAQDWYDSLIGAIAG